MLREHDGLQHPESMPIQHVRPAARASHLCVHAAPCLSKHIGLFCSQFTAFGACFGRVQSTCGRAIHSTNNLDARQSTETHGGGLRQPQLPPPSILGRSDGGGPPIA